MTKRCACSLLLALLCFVESSSLLPPPTIFFCPSLPRSTTRTASSPAVIFLVFFTYFPCTFAHTRIITYLHSFALPTYPSPVSTPHSPVTSPSVLPPSSFIPNFKAPQAAAHTQPASARRPSHPHVPSHSNCTSRSTTTASPPSAPAAQAALPPSLPPPAQAHPPRHKAGC